MALIIYDLDGTLIDSSIVMTEAFQIAYKIEVGDGPVPLEVLFKNQGMAFKDILKAGELPLSMAEHFERESSLRIDDIVCFDSVIEHCVRMKNLGHSIVLLTGKDRARTELILSKFGISNLFERVITASDGIKSKPEPEPIWYLCNEFGFAVNETIMVGDAVNDILAAKNAGTFSIGCGWGLNNAAELYKAAADLVAPTPESLDGSMDAILSSMFERSSGESSS